MRILKISKSYFDKFPYEKYELLPNKDEAGRQRPYVLLLSLKYKGVNRPFAIPFRSNLSEKVPPNEYFSLPPRPTTRKFRKHALQFSKMFPVNKKYYEKYNPRDNDWWFDAIRNLIERKKHEIVDMAQAYLDKCENEGYSELASKIDDIIEILDKKDDIICPTE